MADTITTQMLLNAGLNAFGLELFLESYWYANERSKVDKDEPLTFIYRGVKVELTTIEIPPHIGAQVDRKIKAEMRPPATPR